MNRKDLKFGIAVLLWFPFLIAGAGLGLRVFFLHPPKAESAFEAILLAALLLICGAGGVLLGTVAWMLLMRPFFNKDDMRFLLFSHGGEVPLLTRFLTTIVDVLY